MLSEISPRQKVTVMVGVLTAMLLSALDQTIVSTALPRIVQDLNGIEHLSWVVTSYLLASTVIVPIYGKLSDIYGRKGFFMAAVVIFLVGSALSGQSHSMTQLIAFRAVQGIGGGAIMANAFAIIGDLFSPAERGRWQGVTGGVFGLASVIGPALGGYLTDHASWRWTFYINLPVGIAALILLGLLMPKIAPGAKNRSIDYGGAVTLAVGLIALLLGFVWGGNQYPWESWQIYATFSVALVALLSFAIVEMGAKEPILPLELFKNPIFSVSAVIIFLSGVTLFGAILYIPLFAQGVLGISATNSGTILTPLMLGLVASSIVGGQILSRTGRYKVLAVTGMGLVFVSLFLLSRMTAQTTQLGMVWRMVLVGLGLGATLPVFNVAVQNAFDRSKLGVVTASVQLFRSIGGTVGTAIMGGVLNTGLANRIGDSGLGNNSFYQHLHQTSTTFGTLNANTVQELLSKQVEAMITTSFSTLPTVARQAALVQFSDFLGQVKSVYADSITHVFLVASLMTAVAFFASFFLKEVPLQGASKTPVLAVEKSMVGVDEKSEVKKGKRQELQPAISEVSVTGLEFGREFGTFPARQPKVVLVDGIYSRR
jgi:EmrB/QacA subfamily drug resistance transporter